MDRRAHCAELIRQYGQAPEAVERAMLEAGFGEVTAHASRDMFAGWLERHGYGVMPLPAKTANAEPVPIETTNDAAEPAPRRGRPPKTQETNP